jgi:hypothetical protein
MKKILLLSVLVFNIFNLYSQTQITLTFTAKDSVSQNPISLDSVYVKNLVENCDTLLYGPAPVLLLSANWPVGINETSANSQETFILKQNYPNPFQGSTFVSIYREYQGTLNLTLYDELGTKLVEYHNRFEKGSHSFVISSSGNKVLFLVVSDEKNYRPIKIVSTGQSNESGTIRYLGLTNPFKKSSPVNTDNPGFIFYLGNHMMYTAYVHGFHNNIKYDAPTANTTYTFSMIPSFTIGQSYGGGIIFYIDGTGQHGLISATSDQSSGAQWGCFGTLIGGTGTAIGTGQANTTAIVNGCSTPGIAAQICDALVLNGYSDWFLPSKDELNQMYIQKTVIGGFIDYYWSSSEKNAGGAWYQYFPNGAQDYNNKYTTYYVRAVRAF